ncbi:MAG: AMIN domain-containing protein [candidate division WOR-3 bacterium]
MSKTVLVTTVLVLGLAVWTAAEEQAAVTGIAVDKLLDGVRVTIACKGNPNVSSFLSEQPAAVVLDFMGTTSKLDRDRIESNFYPVSAVTVQPSEATSGLRVAVRLRDLVEHSVTREEGLVIVNLGTTPVVSAPPAESEDPFAGKKVTLYVKDAEIGDVLRMLAGQFNLNVLVTQDVKSVVTVRLADVPLRTAVEALLKAALCDMVEGDGGVFIIKPVKKDMYGQTLTRVFTLDYVEAQDAVDMVQKVLSDRGTARIGYRRVGKGGGAERSAVIVVTDIPEALDGVAQVIAEIDRPVPQVSIEAKFVETTHSAEDRYGIEWTIAASAATGPFDPDKDFGFPLVYGEMVLGKVKLDQFRATLEVMASRGNARILASPTTITMDNQTAVVSMGLDVPVREVRKDRETGEVIYSWTKRSIPISLEVTPHVTSDGRVTMNVKPSVEAITGWVGSADDQQPIVAKRSAETQVTVGDGEVAVIGGLVREETTHNVGKIPLLGDIPILGHLFKKTTVRREKNDLMIFIIPHVLPAEG